MWGRELGASIRFAGEGSRLPEQEWQKQQRIVPRGTTSSMRFRRAMVLLILAGGGTVPVVA